MGNKGLLPLAPGATTAPGPVPARVAAVAARNGDGPGEPSCAIAIEDWGAAFLALSPDGSSLRLVQMAIESLDGLDIGGLWDFASGWLLPTFRDPFAAEGEGNSASRPGALLTLTPKGVRIFPLPSIPDMSAGFEPFAFLPAPGSPDTWLAQFRDSKTAKSSSVWIAYSGFESGPASGRKLTREAFEAALAPRPLSEAPPILTEALSPLREANGSSALLRLDGENGQSSWYTWGSDPASSREMHAWSDDRGDLLVLSPVGRASLILGADVTSVAAEGTTKGDGRKSLVFPLPAPVTGAFFTGCALFGEPGRVHFVASWEGEGESGIVVGSALE